MDYFVYRASELFSEEVPVTEVAKQFGTPLYLYSKQTLIDHFQRITDAFAVLKPRVCFSVKSCHNLHILRLLQEAGAWFDAVSGGEIQRAIEAGAAPETIVFAGVGKTFEEIEFAVRTGVKRFNVESKSELDALAQIAETNSKTVQPAIRVNPDVDAKTHPYTTTGKKENKFGVPIDQAVKLYHRYSTHPFCQVTGLHLHIGSPVNTTQPYVEAITRGLDLIKDLKNDGITINAINIGGGYGAHYDGAEAPAAADYAAHIVPLLKDSGLEVLMEPGRSISANAGILVTKVVRVKETAAKRFVITDAAMTDLFRPALYGAYHFIWPVSPGEQSVPDHRGTDLKISDAVLCDVVGGVCESSDFLGKDRWLPPVKAGDLLAVFTAGAYGSSMSSQYNSRPRAAEVLVFKDNTTLIRRRETYEDLVAAEREV